MTGRVKDDNEFGVVSIIDEMEQAILNNFAKNDGSSGEAKSFTWFNNVTIYMDTIHAKVGPKF